jgi:hypothetical protein
VLYTFLFHDLVPNKKKCDKRKRISSGPDSKPKRRQKKDGESLVEDRTCPRCGKVFHCPSRMQQHLNAVHERKILFNCKVCHRGFYRKDSLRIHSKSHLTVEEQAQLELAESKFLQNFRCIVKLFL